MSTDILKDIQKDLNSHVTSANFEGANIVFYTEDIDFFRDNQGKIKELVNKYKKRIELRADEKILKSQDETRKIIKDTIPEEAELTDVLFDPQRSIVVIEAKKPGLVIGREGSILKEIKDKSLWIPQVQRSPAIKSKITENIRAVLYQNNNTRKRFLNLIGKKIYKEWNPEKVEEWVRVTFLGGGRQVGRSCILLSTPQSKVLLDCGINVAGKGKEKFPYLDVSEFKINELDAIILSHAHLDHGGLIPYLFKMGYRGPVYMSVDYSEPVMIKENGITKKVKIGEFIDSKIEKSERIEKSPLYEYNAISPDKDIEAISFSNSDYKIGFKKIKKLIRHKICDGDNLYKIKTKTNRDITVTGSHSVFILKKGEVKEAKVSELKEGDYLVVPHKLPSTYIDEINISEVLEEFNSEGEYLLLKQGNKIPKKLKVSEELMRILGYFAAEGNFDKRSLQFSFGLKDMNYVKQLEEDTEKVFGIKPRTNVSKGNVLRVCINSKLIRELFFRLFFKDHTKAISKRVPEIVFNSNNKLKLQFLKAYLNGDGTLNYHNKTAVAMSVSKELISDLTYICSQIGFNYHTHEGYMGKDAKTKNKVYQLIINMKDLFDENSTCIAKTNLIPLKESLFEDEWYYHRLKTKMHVTKERLISLLNSNLIKYKDSIQIKATLSKLANSDLSFLPITKIDIVKPTNGFVYDISVEGDQNFVAGENPICLHNTAPTRDISALLALDFIGVAYKQASAPLFSSIDIKEMVKHTICLEYNEVTDIAPDIRITLYNAGHALGSALVHMNIGNGAHNLVYSGDFKFDRTRLLDRAICSFPRIETLIVESTYGSKNDILPTRKEAEDQIINEIKATIEKNGKVLIPELGLGRAQETMLILEEAMKNNLLPKIPIYVDGMIWDINGIHTAYPDFLNSNIRREIFQDNNPFVSDTFQRIGSSAERKQVIEGGPCVVLATSGMLQGGASVEYFRHFSSSKNNKMCFVCYQGQGSLGRQVQDGMTQLKMNVEGKEEDIEVKMEVITIPGFTAHAGRKELLDFVNRCQPKPNRIIINHGEQSKCLDLASSIYKLHHIETGVPRNLETIRLK